MSTVAKLLASLELDTSSFTKSISTIPRTLGSLGGDFSQIGGAITRGVTLPLLAAGAAAIALSGRAVQVGADFEKAMSGVGAILGATQEEMQKLSDTAIDLGLDPNLIVSASQAAGVMEELAKNGLTATQIMDGAAKAAIALANATGTDFATAAQIAATAMSLFNIQAEDMSRVVDQVTAVANTSRFTTEDFALAIGMGGAAAQNAGIQFEEFAAVIAALADYTTSGSDAGTSFKTLLTRLVPYTDAATTAMQELGIITEDGSNQFFDAAGNMKSMAEIAGILERALSGLSTEERILALHTLFGTDASRAAIGLMETGEQGFKDLMAAMGKTDAADNAATRMDNLAGAMEILSGIVEAFQIKFTRAVGPGIREAAESVSEFLSKNSGEIERLFASLSVVFMDMGKNLGPWLEENGPKMIDFLGRMLEILPDIVMKFVELGSIAAPILEKLAVAFLNMDSEKTMDTLMRVGTLAVIVIGVLGPVITVLGSIVTTVASIISLVGSLGPVFTAIGNVVLWVVGGINLALVSGVILPLLVIVGTIGLVVYAFATNFMGITTTVQQLWFIIQYYFSQIGAWIVATITKAVNDTVTRFNFLAAKAAEIKLRFDAFAAGVVAAIQRVIQKVLELAAALLKLQLPKDLKPGSPTPFEIGLVGIADAMDRINSTGLEGINGVRSPAFTKTGSGRDSGSLADGGRSSTTIVIHNPRRETSEESLRKTLNRLSYLR